MINFQKLKLIIVRCRKKKEIVTHVNTLFNNEDLIHNSAASA